MSRIRSIKPAFFRSLSIADLDIGARLTFIGLWTYVDDKGRGVDDTRLVKAEIWPLDDRYTAKKVDEDLKAMEKHDHICRYQAADGRYLHVVKWKTHQVINRPQPSQHPPCPIHDESGNDHGTTPPDAGTTHPPDSDDSVNGHGARTTAAGTEGKGSGSGSGKEVSPGFTGTHDPDPQAVENRDLELEQPPPKPGGDLTAALTAIGNRGWDSDPPTDPAWEDPLANRLVAVCAGQRPETIRREAELVTTWARRHVDDQVIDEAVGYLEQADQKPNLPRAAAKLIRAKAADHGIQIPEFKPPTKAVS